MSSSLLPGIHLGRYEIRSKIGAGGMGEVYRARDEKLNRDVAIKVLPAAFSEDVNRLRRFEQEAQATGTLNHPNILAVYDVGIHEGAPYVVSELLEGETLRHRLSEGSLAQRKAIDYAVQIAWGLAGAHEKAIVHRDLKPDNIFITKDDRVKILDFGLAKLVEPMMDGLAQTDIATRKVHTDPGTVVGTVGYMSPEQVRGQAVDQRSDIFSFGAVLYEMLCGQRAFRGDSAVETLNAILKEEPEEIGHSNAKINPALERIVRRCLEKKPEQRFHSANDLAFAIEALSGSTSTSAQTVAMPIPATGWIRKHERVLWTVAVGVLLLSLVAFAITYFQRAPAEAVHAIRFPIFPTEQAAFIDSAVSPDGRRLVVNVRDSSGKTLLWVRSLDSLATQPLPGTDGAVYPFWSPDSRSIGFFADGKLKKIEVAGGPSQTLCDALDGRGGAWNRGGVIIFTPDGSNSLFRVPASGGIPVPITTLDTSRQELSHRFPCLLPDGHHFLYLSQTAQLENSGIYVGSLDSKKTERLLDAGVRAVYAPPGVLLFMRERTLMAQPFAADKLQLNGEPFPVADQIGSNFVVGFASFSASDNGVLAYLSGNIGNSQLTLFDRGGKVLSTVGSAAGYANIFFSPDEKRVAAVTDALVGKRDIWLLDLARGTPTRFTFEAADDFLPVWSPDGSRIVFTSDREGPGNLYQKLASGTGNEEQILKTGERKWPSDWSKDGRFIIFTLISPKTKNDLWVLPMTGEQKPEPFLQSPFNEDHGRFSPDGRFIAYASDESGKFEVYVQTFPASGGKWQVSTAGGAQPRWRRDGKEIYYISPDRKLMAAEVKAFASTFEVGVPKVLFQTRVVGYPNPRNYYEVSADGQRFLITSLLEEATSTPITVVVNWTADLKR